MASLKAQGPAEPWEETTWDWPALTLTRRSGDSCSGCVRPAEERIEISVEGCKKGFASQEIRRFSRQTSRHPPQTIFKMILVHAQFCRHSLGCQTLRIKLRTPNFACTYVSCKLQHGSPGKQYTCAAAHGGGRRTTMEANICRIESQHSS